MLHFSRPTSVEPSYRTYVALNSLPFCGLLLLAVWPGCTAPASAPPAGTATLVAPTPGVPGLAVFYGSVKIDGAAAGEGLTVVADANGVNCGSGTIRSARYELAVASDSEKRGCGKPSDPVVFRWLDGSADGGRPFDQRAAWQPTSQQLDLTLKTR